MTPANASVPCPVCGLARALEAQRCSRCGTEYGELAVGTGESPTLIRLKATEPIEARVIVDDLVETLSSRFQGLRRLGQGGMGLVYVARDPLLKRDVAIKVLAPEFSNDAGARERFVREAQAAAAVAHPNVVNVFQVGELKATRLPYFVMQFVEGNTVEQEYPQGTTVLEPVARRVIAEVAAALAAAHARGLVHRDIKPANVMLDPHTGRAIVLDFGISASVQHQARDERLTAAGVYIGTPRYMSPEQAAGDQVTDKSDIYSLGCVAYELLTGQPVFEAKSMIALFAAHMRDTPRPLAELRPGVDVELAALISRCLEKDPQKRPSADEIAQRLSPGGAVLLEWPPPGLEWMHQKLGGLVRLMWAASALVLATALPLILAGGRIASVSDSTATLLLLAPGVLGIGVLGGAVWRAVRLGRAVTDAVKHGYAWRTVAETIADPDGETGGLITGSRRFAALSAEQRAELRRGRLTRAVALLAGGLAPLPALYLVLVLASVIHYDQTAALTVLLFPTIGALIATRSTMRERRLATPMKDVRQQTEAVEATRLAPVWYESFDRAQIGQELGGGSRERPGLGVAGAALVAGLSALILTVLLPIVMIAVMGAAILQRELPKFSSATEKSRFAEVTRQYVVERDARMTAMEAGTLFYSLQSDLGRESRVAMLPRPPRPKRPWTDNPPGPALFATARPNEWTGPAFGKILEAAPHGFSPDEMVYLQMIASAALWRDWDRVARASSMDAFGASVVLPLAKDMSFAEVPVAHFVKLKEVAYASASRAAYYMARKQLDSAEFVLKSTASFGFVMADNASNLLEQLIGIVIVGIGRDALIRFYAVTGNASGGHLKTARDSALAIWNARSEATDLVAAGGSAPTPSAPVARARMLAGAMRPGMQRSIRMQYLAFVGITPCTNLRELAFGPDPDVREAFDRARREIARFPSDSAQIDLMYESSARGYSGVERTASTRVGLALASFAGMLLHNPRVRGCAEMLFASSELF